MHASGAGSYMNLAKSLTNFSGKLAESSDNDISVLAVKRVPLHGYIFIPVLAGSIVETINSLPVLSAASASISEMRMPAAIPLYDFCVGP